MISVDEYIGFSIRSIKLPLKGYFDFKKIQLSNRFDPDDIVQGI